MTIGHQRNIAYLQRILQKGTLAHAYLFHGPEAVGKRAVAMAVTQALLCERDQARFGGCGGCESCGLLERRSHPDFILLAVTEPLLAEDGRGIGIKNIHELQRRLSLSSWRGGRKVAVIDGAEALSRDAQSALLKTIEEPDSRTVFFLITHRPEALLATIRSRSVGMSFAPVAEEAMTQLLDGVPVRKQAELLELADGRPGVLVRLVGDKKFLDEFSSQQKQFEKILDAHLGEQFSFSERASREPGVLESLVAFIIRSVRRDLQALLGGSAAEQGRTARRPPAARLPDGQGRAGASAPQPASRASLLAAILDRLALIETTTANRRLIADAIFFDLATRFDAGGKTP